MFMMLWQWLLTMLVCAVTVETQAWLWSESCHSTRVVWWNKCILSSAIPAEFEVGALLSRVEPEHGVVDQDEYNADITLDSTSGPNSPTVIVLWKRCLAHCVPRLIMLGGALPWNIWVGHLLTPCWFMADPMITVWTRWWRPEQCRRRIAW